MLKLKCYDFDLKQTLECGQIFRFNKISDNEYIIFTQLNIAHLIQQDDKDSKILLIDSNNNNENFWIEYFDLNTDYKEIKESLSKDEIMKSAISYGSGIHILKQDFEEMLISFIMSQNKQIPQIKQCINLYCQYFGEEQMFQNEKYFSFPRFKELPTLEDLRKCKIGFRDKYILDALLKIKEGYFNNIKELSEKEQEDKILSIKGVGSKVCNCVMLFGLSRTERFPIDVWIKRLMQDLYFDGEKTNNKIISDKANDLFGKFSGFAQQYLFYAGISKANL